MSCTKSVVSFGLHFFIALWRRSLYIAVCVFISFLSAPWYTFELGALTCRANKWLAGSVGWLVGWVSKDCTLSKGSERVRPFCLGGDIKSKRLARERRQIRNCCLPKKLSLSISLWQPDLFLRPRLAAAANLIIRNFASAAALDAKFYRLSRTSHVV